MPFEDTCLRELWKGVISSLFGVVLCIGLRSLVVSQLKFSLLDSRLF